jgi:hypothetical protein
VDEQTTTTEEAAAPKPTVYPPLVDAVEEHAVKPNRKRLAVTPPEEEAPPLATIHNRTRRVIVATDTLGAGLHLFPGVPVEINQSLISRDLTNLARSGLISITQGGSKA